MRFCPGETRRQSYLWCGLAGTAAGIVQSFISCPMELVKTRAQLSSTPVFQCMRQIMAREGGKRALFRGFGITLARDTPAFATYFVTYEYLLDTLKRPGAEFPSTWNMLAAGGSAGALSWLIIYPLDVIKSRMQADARFASTKDCILDAWRTEGASAFMRGASPTLLRAFPTNAATFAVVSWTLYTYEYYRPNRLNAQQILD